MLDLHQSKKEKIGKKMRPVKIIHMTWHKMTFLVRHIKRFENCYLGTLNCLQDLKLLKISPHQIINCSTMNGS